jgi:hypothetical protein
MLLYYERSQRNTDQAIAQDCHLYGASTVQWRASGISNGKIENLL